MEAKLNDASEVFVTTSSFKTAPDPKTERLVRSVTSTFQYFWNYDNDERGFNSYDSMNSLNSDFFVHTGDYVDYDKPDPLAKTAEKARHKWHAMNSGASLVDFYKKASVYMVKDDHDLLKDDVYPTSDPYGQLTFNECIKIWNENAPTLDEPKNFRFRTPAAEGENFAMKIAFGSCPHRWGLGNHKLLDRIQSRGNHALLLGDIAVQDRNDHLGLHRADYLLRDFLPAWKDFIAGVPIYASWDDHDYFDNDKAALRKNESTPK